jgi:SAM-dependent methyltransferase
MHKLEDLIRREFNRWAEQGRGRGMQQSHWNITRQMFDLMSVSDYDNVLDLGCGVGWASRVMAERVPSGIVVGVDLSDKMISQALHEYRNPPNVFFTIAEASALPCPNALFDTLISVESIYYYPDLPGTFAEVSRILKRGGHAQFLINFYEENPYTHGWAKHLDMPVQLLSAPAYVELLANAGLAATHRRIVDSTPIPEDWSPSRWFPELTDQVGFQTEGALLLTAVKN